MSNPAKDALAPLIYRRMTHVPAQQSASERPVPNLVIGEVVGRTARGYAIRDVYGDIRLEVTRYVSPYSQDQREDAAATELYSGDSVVCVERSGELLVLGSVRGLRPAEPVPPLFESFRIPPPDADDLPLAEHVGVIHQAQGIALAYNEAADELYTVQYISSQVPGQTPPVPTEVSYYIVRMSATGAILGRPHHRCHGSVQQLPAARSLRQRRQLGFSSRRAEHSQRPADLQGCEPEHPHTRDNHDLGPDVDV